MRICYPPKLWRNIFFFAAIATLCGPGFAAPPTITEFSVPLVSTNGLPAFIANGSDGALWFTEHAGNAIGRITTSGSVSVFPLPTPNSSPGRIVLGSDNALWFTEQAGKIGRITTTGVITEFTLETNYVPWGIALAPDGNLWFTGNVNGQQSDNGFVGRITPAGIITIFPFSGSIPTPMGIVTGSDGALWFTELDSGVIGRVTTTGVFTQFPLGSNTNGPQGITAGPNGALWFTNGTDGDCQGTCANSSGNSIGQITTGGAIMQFTIPTANSNPQEIVTASDGALWFVEATGNNIGRITTGGVFTEFAIPTPNSFSVGITVGSDGALWFTEAGASKIGRITAAGTITEFTVPPVLINGLPAYVTNGSDGALWFTENSGNAIGRITTSGSVSVFPLPTPNSSPGRIVLGPDNALWFAEEAGRIGRITTAGVITEYPLTLDGEAEGITSAADGNLWFTQTTDGGGGSIGRITPAGVITNFPFDSGQIVTPMGITVGSDGALWFTELDSGVIGRIITAGAITQFPLGSNTNGPQGITAGPNGALWFTDGTQGNCQNTCSSSSGNSIGQITVGGTITQFTIPTANSDPQEIVTAPDGALWFVEANGNNIGKITTGGVFNEFAIPTPNSFSHGITVGSDGALWFTESGVSKIGRFVIPPGNLQVSPATSIASSGSPGGPFSPTSFNYSISAVSGSVNYSISGTPSWLTASSTSGTVTTTPTVVTFTVNSDANSLSDGTYNATITFTDATNNVTTQTISATLTVALPQTLVLNPSTNISSSGGQGGGFTPSSFQYQLNASSGSINYSISGLPAWLNADVPSGALTTSPTTVTFSVNSNANNLSPGNYSATISFANITNGQGNQNRTAALTVNTAASSGNGTSKTYVSAQTGTDAGDCPVAAPCASLNYALSVTGAGGEVTILDGGTFGPVVLTQAVTISGSPSDHAQIIADPSAQVGCVSGTAGSCSANNGYAVEIAAGVVDVVKLSNLVVQMGSSGGIGALKLTSGGQTEITNNVFRGDSAATTPIILMAPNTAGIQSEVYFSNSDIGFNNAGNANAGAVLVQPQGTNSLKLHFNHVEVHNASFGIRTDGSSLSSPSAVVASFISESEFFSFPNAAVNAFSTSGTGTVNAVFDFTRILNAGVALKANGAQSFVILTNNTVGGNTIGVQQQNGATVLTSHNSAITGNGPSNNQNVSGTVTQAPLQ